MATSFLCMLTYVIGHYNPSVRIIDLVSHTTYVGVNFIQFEVDFERNILEKLFVAMFLFTFTVFGKNLLSGNHL